jgi:hypothetical protein
MGWVDTVGTKRFFNLLNPYKWLVTKFFKIFTSYRRFYMIYLSDPP